MDTDSIRGDDMTAIRAAGAPHLPGPPLPPHARPPGERRETAKETAFFSPLSPGGRECGGREGEGGVRGPAARTTLALAKTVGSALWLLCFFSLPAHAEELQGRVQLLARGGQGPARGSDVRQAVVYFEPAGAPPVRPPETAFEMVTRRKTFEPRLLVIPRGSRVRFPNADPILHNAFSVSSPNQFDLGLSSRGPGKEKRFEEPGLVRVFCNVHHDMVAYILVLDTPYHVSPNANGEFVLN